jgi:hypothetical protein
LARDEPQSGGLRRRRILNDTGHLDRDFGRFARGEMPDADARGSLSDGSEPARGTGDAQKLRRERFEAQTVFTVLHGAARPDGLDSHLAGFADGDRTGVGCQAQRQWRGWRRGYAHFIGGLTLVDRGDCRLSVFGVRLDLAIGDQEGSFGLLHPLNPLCGHLGRRHAARLNFQTERALLPERNFQRRR